MNKTYFFLGFSIFALETIALVAYLLASINYSWLSWELASAVIGFTVLGIFNITALILIFVGVFSKDEDKK